MPAVRNVGPSVEQRTRCHELSVADCYALQAVVRRLADPATESFPGDRP